MSSALMHRAQPQESPYLAAFVTGKDFTMSLTISYQDVQGTPPETTSWRLGD